MEIEKIIERGYAIKKQCTQSTDLGDIISGAEYAEWLAYSRGYLQMHYPDNPQTEEFIQIAKKADGMLSSKFDTLIGILNTIKKLSSSPDNLEIDSVDAVLEKICINFHRCVKAIMNRHDNRQTLNVTDEYDVQDLLLGILKLFVEDIRPEDYVPSYAGGNSRTDFYLPQYDTFIETKMTRKSLRDKDIGEQLSIDIARYRDSCKKLICLVYDKDGLLSNPHGLISDLEKLSSDGMKVKVYVTPL